jgi:hypothetical protein
MPHKDERLDGGRGMVRVWTGAVAASELTAATVADYLGRENWPKVEYFISDFTGVTDLQATTDEIRELSSVEARTATFVPGLAMAVVAPSDFMYGMARMWQVFAQETGWSVGVFRSRAEADAWVRELIDGPSKTQK